MTPTNFLLVVLIQGYRWLISPILPPSCRFWPSCSDYAVEAVQIHGAITGTWLAARRLARCHPWGGMGGPDPVPVPGGDCCAAAGRTGKPIPRTSALGEPLV